ncbi:MAG: HEAT repeat protein [Planctomycetota bacterium]|jgi:HEAT repeat protein
MKHVLLAVALLAGATLAASATGEARATVAPPSSAAVVSGLAGGDELDLAEKALSRASHKDTLAERVVALDALVGLGDADGVMILVKRYASASQGATDSRKDLDENTQLLERRRVQLAKLELAAERKSSMKPAVSEMKEQIEELEQKIEKATAKLAIEEPWTEALRVGTRDLVAAQASGKQKGVVKQLWKSIDKSDKSSTRVACAKVLADIGTKDTAKRLAGIALDALDDRVKMMKALPELEADVHKWERKMQEEADKLGGNTNGTMASYMQVQGEAASLRMRTYRQKQLARDFLVAAATGLGNEPEAEQDKAIGSLLKLAQKSPHRLRIVEVLVDSKVEAARVGLLAMLEKESEPLLQVAVLDGISQAGDKRIVPWILATGLADESWHVRSRCMAAIGILRPNGCVEALMAAMEVEGGRVRQNAEEALQLLTAMDFNGNLTLWQRWWADNKDGFVVSDAVAKSDMEKALEGVGMSFFGLRSESEKVLFVLDASGSMNEPMQAYSGGGKAGETRLTVAKRELLKALTGVKNGGTVNIVVYAADVWTWSEDPVILDAETRADAQLFIEEIVANGGTNIWGCMERGLEMAGGKKGKKGAAKWVEPSYDTLFLLTDGQPSIGVSLDREEILDMVSEANESLGIVVNTIGLSSDQDAVLMRRLAEENDGAYAAR